MAHAPTGTQVQLRSFSDLRSRLSESNSEQIFLGDQPLTADDWVIVRTMSVGSLELIVYRMDCLAMLQAQGTRVFNRPRALETAIDKYLCLARLSAAGLPVPATHTSQQWEVAVAGFEQLGGDVIVKPLFGSQGRGLIRVCDGDHAVRVFRSLQAVNAVIYQQRFVANDGSDCRVLQLGSQQWAIRRWANAGDWRTNVSRGAKVAAIGQSSGADGPEEVQEIAALAKQSLRCLDLEFGGVDIIKDANTGQWKVLEVNAVPGWSGVEQVHRVSIAREIWEYLEQTSTHR